MLELTVQNIEAYIASKPEAVRLPGARFIATEEITDETYVNWIFKITLQDADGRHTVYLRQSRDFVKSKPDFAFPASRIVFENKVLRFLNTLTHDVVPEVLYFDADNHVLWLSDIKRGCPLYVHELFAGRPHPEVAAHFGAVIGSIHAATVGINHEQVRGSQAENDEALAFHRGMRAKPALEKFPTEMQALLAESDAAPQVLVLGDLASKNIFIDTNKIRFLDLERAHVGDAVFDLAFLFCHTLLETPEGSLDESLQFITNFLSAYTVARASDPSFTHDVAFMNRLARYVGVMLLYRLKGFYLARGLTINRERWCTVAEKLICHAGIVINVRELIQHYVHSI